MSTGTFYDGALTANPMRVVKTQEGYDTRTTAEHIAQIEADFAAYRRETDVKIAVQHTELVSLHTEFRKLFDAVQHIGEPGFTMPEGNFHVNE